MNETGRLIDALIELDRAVVAFKAGQTGIKARNSAIVHADRAGATAQQIAVCVGISPKRVWQILRSVPEDGHETP